jgi:flagellar protein FliO/FliZ
MLLVASLPASVSAEGGSVFDAINGSAPSSNAPAGDEQPAAIPGSDSGSLFGYLVQVVFSLGFIILLIYLLLRFFGKRQIGQNKGPIKVISATALGNGKTVQVVMIGESLYILGVGDDVQLLKHIPPGEEADAILAEAEIQPLANAWAWLPFGKKKQAEEEEELFLASGMEDKSFQEILSRQWNDVQKKPLQKNEWMQEEDQDRGDLR